MADTNTSLKEVAIMKASETVKVSTVQLERESSRQGREELIKLLAIDALLKLLDYGNCELKNINLVHSGMPEFVDDAWVVPQVEVHIEADTVPIVMTRHATMATSTEAAWHYFCHGEAFLDIAELGSILIGQMAEED